MAEAERKRYFVITDGKVLDESGTNRPGKVVVGTYDHREYQDPLGTAMQSALELRGKGYSVSLAGEIEFDEVLELLGRDWEKQIDLNC